MKNSMRSGIPGPAGAIVRNEGVNFSLFSAAATAVELCLFDQDLQAVESHFLPGNTDGVWHGFLPGCEAGQRYAYRVHGDWDPQKGLRSNPAKLLIDPYARQLDGRFTWSKAVFDHEPDPRGKTWIRNDRDSSAWVPKSVVVDRMPVNIRRGPKLAWSDLIIYETHVRGFTMRHPAISASERGTFRGLSNGQIIAYLKSLGITSVELMPVQTYIDEAFLAARGLRNYWGYNPIHFFTPDPRFGNTNANIEFRDMVDSIHDAGLEVILDVVYNHTGEGDERGPSLSFRGIDNLTYYRSEKARPERLVNHSGCGNTLNVDQPVVRQLILDSLDHWYTEMGVDGFRFDLATVLGRSDNGFDSTHPLLESISRHPRISGARLIAEPWDTGPDGYQLGQFSAPWAEWNDRYRDTVRRFWHGEPKTLGDLAKNMHGSSDLFESNGRKPSSSINFITSHDGFTLTDLVSYKKKHNRDNGQENRDGHDHNFSCNHGVEGPSNDPQVVLKRDRHRLNLLATLLFSQGTPMLLAGDEFGNSQNGNNNAYAQDNETTWLDWRQCEHNPVFLNQVKQIIALRKSLPLLRQPTYAHEIKSANPQQQRILWLSTNGQPMELADWSGKRQLSWLLSTPASNANGKRAEDALAILINGEPKTSHFELPVFHDSSRWKVRFHSSERAPEAQDNGWLVAGDCLVLVSVDEASVY